MIELLIIGGLTALAAISARKSSTPTKTAGTSASSSAPASSTSVDSDGIFHTPESRALYSAATRAVTYNAPTPRATIPIQPGTPPAPAVPVQLTRLGVKLRMPAPVASRPVTSARTISTRVGAPQRQKFSLL